MSTRAHKTSILAFSIPLIALVGISSIAGLLLPALYEKETADWISQSTTQDAVDLFLLLPILTISSLFAYRQERLAEPIWGGSLLFLIYTFVIYCFNIHFNSLFLVYVAILGLSTYGFLYFLNRQFHQPTVKGLTSEMPVKVIGNYFLVIALLFYGLWLMEVLPASVQGYSPRALIEAGLFTNPVHVIDLSFFLPAIFITGIFLLRRKSVGFIIAPVLLVFFVLIDITIAVIMTVQSTTSGQNNSAAIGVMALLAVVSGGFLTWFLRKSY
jgi:hypothetical protein